VNPFVFGPAETLGYDALELCRCGAIAKHAHSVSVHVRRKRYVKLLITQIARADDNAMEHLRSTNPTW
jgi:hypothetical protein